QFLTDFAGGSRRESLFCATSTVQARIDETCGGRMVAGVNTSGRGRFRVRTGSAGANSRHTGGIERPTDLSVHWFRRYSAVSGDDCGTDGAGLRKVFLSGGDRQWDPSDAVVSAAAVDRATYARGEVAGADDDAFATDAGDAERGRAGACVACVPTG